MLHSYQVWSSNFQKLGSNLLACTSKNWFLLLMVKMETDDPFWRPLTEAATTRRRRLWWTCWANNSSPLLGGIRQNISIITSKTTLAVSLSVKQVHKGNTGQRRIVSCTRSSTVDGSINLFSYFELRQKKSRKRKVDVLFHSFAVSESAVCCDNVALRRKICKLMWATLILYYSSQYAFP